MILHCLVHLLYSMVTFPVSFRFCSRFSTPAPPQVQPRTRKSTSNTGMGTPSNQSNIHPIFPCWAVSSLKMPLLFMVSPSICGERDTTSDVFVCCVFCALIIL